MSETEKNEENIEEAVPQEEKRPAKSKENYTFYTIISVLLFFALFFAYKFISKTISADYYMERSAEQLIPENFDMLKSYSGIEYDNITGIRLEHIERKNYAVIYFDGLEDIETFAEEHILYEYGDVAEDIRVKIYPYENNASEYVFAKGYVNIDNPNIYCYVYEYDEEYYAEYHSDRVTPEFSSLFRDSEKNQYFMQ